MVGGSNPSGRIMEIPIEKYTEINEDILYWLGFDLSKTQIENIIDLSKNLVEDLQKNKMAWDTTTREMFADALCNHLLGFDWPCGCDNIDDEEFADMLDEAAKKFKYVRNSSYHHSKTNQYMA